MPWFAWIVIAALIVGGCIAVASVWAERSGGQGLGAGSAQDRGEIERLKRRIAELERQQAPRELEEPHIPTRAEENLTAEDRWRLDMLEARLEGLEGRADQQEAPPQDPGPQDSGSQDSGSEDSGPEGSFDGEGPDRR